MDEAFSCSMPPRPAPALALPAALFVAWMLDKVGIGLIAQLTLHEFGHGVAAWLGGRWALPIPIAGLTFLGSERSLIVSVGFAAALAALAWRAAERRRWALAGASAAGLALMAAGFLQEEKAITMWVIFGGVAGEMILSALLFSAFNWEVSRRLRWDFWRYPIAVAAACAWLQSFSLWTGAPLGLAGWSMRPQDDAIAHDPRAYVHWLANTPGGNDQDFYRLAHDHGWSEQEIADAYRRVGAGSLLVVALAVALPLLAPKRPAA